MSTARGAGVGTAPDGASDGIRCGRGLGARRGPGALRGLGAGTTLGIGDPDGAPLGDGVGITPAIIPTGLTTIAAWPDDPATGIPISVSDGAIIAHTEESAAALQDPVRDAIPADAHPIPEATVASERFQA